MNKIACLTFSEFEAFAFFKIISFKCTKQYNRDLYPSQSDNTPSLCMLNLTVSKFAGFHIGCLVFLYILSFDCELIHLEMLPVGIVLISRSRFHQRKFIHASASTLRHYQLELTLKQILSLRYFGPARSFEFRLAIVTNSQGEVFFPSSTCYAL